MPIPLIWMAAAAALTPLMLKIEADDANKYATDIKSECDKKYREALGRLEVVSSDMDSKMKEAHNRILLLYRGSVQKSQPIIELYGKSLDGLTSIEAPPGYAAVENYDVPSVKLTTPLLSQLDIAKTIKGAALVSGTYVAGSFLGSMSNAVRDHGIMMLGSALDESRAEASRVKAAADKMKQEVEEFVLEVDSIRQKLEPQLLEAIKDAEIQMQEHLRYLERYIELCQPILAKNKTFAELSQIELKNLGYLYRVLKGVKTFAEKPFTVSI